MTDFKVGDQVHVDDDTEIGTVSYIYRALKSDITVEYQSKRGAGTYTEDWPVDRLRLHARPVYMTAERIEAISEAYDLLHELHQLVSNSGGGPLGDRALEAAAVLNPMLDEARADG